MTPHVFLGPLVAVLVLIVWLVAGVVQDARRRPARARGAGVATIGGPPATYGRAVAAALPGAWRSAGLREQSRPLPAVHGEGRPMGDGVAFPMTAPYAMGELVRLEERVAAALARSVPVGLVRVRPTPGRPGYATLVVSRTHPLATQLPYPVQPGHRPPGGRGLEAVIGQTEFLTPLIVDPRKTSLWVGQNGSGKTWGVMAMLIAMSTFPVVEMTVYDASVKAGSGYAQLGPRLRHGKVLTGTKRINADLRAVMRSLERRAELLDGRPYAPTRDMPLRMIVFEEFPHWADDDDSDLDLVIALAREGREFGLSLQLVAQNAIGTSVDTTLRAELRQRFVFKVDGWRTADLALGEGVRGGDGEDGWSPIPSDWPGVLDSVVTGESGVVRSRVFAALSSLADARAMWGDSVDWGDPRAVPNARMRCFVAQHLAALRAGPPRAIDIDKASSPRGVGT